MYIPDIYNALHLYAIYAEGYSILNLVSVNKNF